MKWESAKGIKTKEMVKSSGFMLSWTKRGSCGKVTKLCGENKGRYELF